MARSYTRLTAAKVKANEKRGKPGLYPDGDRLNQQITKDGVSSWIFRYTGSNGKERKMGFGVTRDVSLAEARDLAYEARRLLRAGKDPLDERRAEELARTIEAGKTKTFRECAVAYMKTHRTEWKNTKHAAQWELTLERLAYPTLGDLPVASIDVPHVLNAIEPIWHRRPETASRVRQRIEAVLDFATVRKYRSGPNPAQWKGNLEHALPKKSAVRKVEHHAALPYQQVSAFIATELRPRDAMTARLLEFIILTGVRSGEARAARWSEINMREKVWEIPGSRMKAGKPHRVPLADAALAVLDKMAAIRSSEFIFAGQSGGPMSISTLPQFLRVIGRTDITTHGFRSAFRDWAAEQTGFPREVAEQALAHTIPNATEAAYRRGDLFAKRAALMSAWGRYCMMPAPVIEGAVVAIGERQR